MKRLLMWLSIIALTACGGGGGGTSTPTTHSISGTTKSGTALSLVKPVSTSWNDVIVVADTTADTTGKYSFSGLTNGDYEVSASLNGNTFSPPYFRLKLNSADYPRVDFAAIPNTAVGGVIFSAPLGVGGYNSLADTHYDSVSGTFVPGGNTSAAGSSYLWQDASGAVASLGYSAGVGFLYFTIGGTTFGLGCGVNAPYGAYPTCSSIGIMFDHSAGIITFVSTPSSVLYPEGITLNGSLRFQPF